MHSFFADRIPTTIPLSRRDRSTYRVFFRHSEE